MKRSKEKQKQEIKQRAERFAVGQNKKVEETP
jgi:hypothetical protein